MLWRCRSSVAAASFALVGGAWVLAACGHPTGASERVVVPTGATFRAATDSLARAHIVSLPRLFRAYAALTHRDRIAKPGTYLFQRGTSWSDVLDALTHGRGAVRLVTIPEGWDLNAIIPLLTHDLAADSDSVVAAMRDTVLLARLGVPVPTLEGYLYPDTYSFPDGTTPRAAIRVMVDEFERAWRPEWDDRAHSLGLTRHEAVTLASIIEKEARVPEERAIISGVYHNRLRMHMPLQADPTVEYALGRHVQRVYYKDLEVVSAYNTYRHPGLPPGPIASPGEASLEAAVTPGDVPYLYFVATPDGHHAFSSTFAEHSEARQELRRHQQGR
jgi:peptidoglycan lytic transglycosylase G